MKTLCKNKILWCMLLSAPVTLQAIPAGYQYFWGDDFSGISVDEGKWQINGPDWGMSTASPTAASSARTKVGGGTLTLEAYRRKEFGSNTAGDEIFEGGLISTDGKPRFSGDCYIEARILLPDTIGSWPAFWGLYTGWPPEMDIMEYPYGAYANDQYHTAFHHAGGSGAGQVNPPNAGDLRGSYHIFAVDWDYNNSVRFYFDGVEVSSFYNSTAVSEMANMYLILNYAVGGWPAVPSTSDWPVGFKDETKVDWVRVWKPGTSKSTDWQGGGAGSNAQWDDAGNWSNGSPNSGGVTANFDTISPETTQTVDITASRTASVINLDGSTRYRFGWDTDRLILGYGDSGAIQPAINIAATTTTGHEFWSQLEWSGVLGINNDSSYPLLLTGALVSGGGININGPGVVSFDGDSNTAVGDVVIDSGAAGFGIARARGRHALGLGGTVVIGEQGNATTARLELENDSLVSNGIDFRGRNNASAGIVNNSGSNTIAGKVSANVGGANYWIQSNAGQLNLTGPVSMSSLATGTRTFTLQGAGNGLVGGAIENGSAGTVNIVKSGAGRWIFEGQNSYSGTTTVSAGELMVNGTTGAGNTTVGNGAILSGGGTINANLIAAVGSTVRIGHLGFPLVPDTTYSLIDDFDGYSIGLGGASLSPAWIPGFPAGGANASSTEIGADAGGGQALHYVYGGSGGQINYTSIGTIAAEGTTGTIFFQAYLTSTGSDTLFAFGRPGAAAYGDLASLFRVPSDLLIEVHNGAYANTSTSISLNTLYNFWVVIDNSANTSSLYYSPGGAGQAPVLIQSGYAFRSSTAGAINTFYLGSNSGSGGFIDNVYIDPTGANLTNPLNTPPMMPDSGMLAVANDFSLPAGSTLEFDVSNSNLYDRLVVGGQFNATGTLKVTLDPEQSAPWVGDVFDLFDAAGGTISFSGYDLPDLAPGLIWDTGAIASGILSVFAIPGGYASYMNDYGLPGALFVDDTNSNGIPNGMEYYLGWNPATPVPPQNIFTWTNDYLSVLYPYNSSALGVTGSVQWTTDLLSSNWYSTGITYVTNAMPDEIEATLGSTTSNQLFLRLKVEN